MVLCVFVLTEFTNVTDTHTHRETGRQTPHDGTELVMGGVHPWVGLGQSFFFNFWWVELGWVET